MTGSDRIPRSIPEGAKLCERGDKLLPNFVGGAKRLRRSRWERGGGWRSRARRTFFAPRTPRQGWADTDECRPRRALRISRSTKEGWADTCADVRVPPSKREPHSTPMRRMGCARVLAARHDALATRLGRVKLTRPRAVRCAHSAPGWGGAEAYALRQQTVKRCRHGRSCSPRTVTCSPLTMRLGEPAVTRCVSPSKHEPRSRHAVGTSAERS